jgi:hypothetical protein
MAASRALSILSLEGEDFPVIWLRGEPPATSFSLYGPPIWRTRHTRDHPRRRTGVDLCYRSRRQHFEATGSMH